MAYMVFLKYVLWGVFYNTVYMVLFKFPFTINLKWQGVKSCLKYEDNNLENKNQKLKFLFMRVCDISLIAFFSLISTFSMKPRKIKNFFY